MDVDLYHHSCVYFTGILAYKFTYNNICVCDRSCARYLWSEVFSSEMYASRFEQPADRSAEEVDKAEREAGARLRRTVFEPAATRDAADLLKDFLGKEPDKQMRAFLRFKGVPLDD